MRSIGLWLGAVLLVVAVRPCWGQFVRPPIVVPRPPVPIPVHVPVHVPAGTHGANQGGGWNEQTWWWVGGGVAGVVGIGGGSLLVYKLRKRAAPRAVVRIIALPPGEAPEPVRQAWVGLLLPLIQGQVQTENVLAQQAVSHQPVAAPSAYAVEAKAAIELLESANPEAAAWWKQNAPEVLAPGYQLIFPAEVCERLDDLANGNVE